MHAKLSASGAHRWTQCAGSVNAEEGLPNTTSIYAEEGTLAHHVASCIFDDTLHTLENIDSVMLEEVIKYVETCPVPKELIDIHNQAAGMNKGDKK